MASIRNEYEITVEPTGRWTVYHIHGECSTLAGTGGEKGPDCMDLAEEAARQFVARRIEALEKTREYRQRCRVFTLPATIRYLHGKRV